MTRSARRTALRSTVTRPRSSKATGRFWRRSRKPRCLPTPITLVAIVNLAKSTATECGTKLTKMTRRRQREDDPSCHLSRPARQWRPSQARFEKDRQVVLRAEVQWLAGHCSHTDKPDV